jgi:hypothetical protein
MITLIEGQNCRRSRQIKLMGIANLSVRGNTAAVLMKVTPFLQFPVPETLTFICILPTSTLISANHIPNRMHDEQIMPKTDYQSSPTRKNSNSWRFSI